MIELKESPEFITILFSNPIDATAYNEAFDPTVFFDCFYTADKTRISNTGLRLLILSFVKMYGVLRFFKGNREEDSALLETKTTEQLINDYIK